MSLQSVRAFFAHHQLNLPILETEALTPTVESAALAHGVEPGRIAKTLAFRLGDGRVVLLVASGHARIDNAKFKTAFGKGKMLPVYLDHSLHAFDEVLPAAGSVNSAVRISPALMAQVTGGVWVDACR